MKCVSDVSYGNAVALINNCISFLLLLSVLTESGSRGLEPLKKNRKAELFNEDWPLFISRLALDGIFQVNSS